MKLDTAKLKQMLEDNTDELNDLLGRDLSDATETCSNEEELREWFERRIDEADILYYSEAMKYLTECDNSLYNAFELAEEYGYTLSDLNSEKLATLVYQDNLMTELSELELSEAFTSDDGDTSEKEGDN